jgi:hypothetical protein
MLLQATYQGAMPLTNVRGIKRDLAVDLRDYFGGGHLPSDT